MRLQANQLSVNNARLQVDPKSGTVTLLVRDQRLQGGEPLKVELSYESEAAQTAYQLLQSENIVSRPPELPTESRLPEKLVGSEQIVRESAHAKVELIDDPRLKLLLGEVEDGNFFQCDLGFATHTLILGAEGTGKTTLLQNLARQLLATPGTELYYFDAKACRGKFALSEQLRPQDILAVTSDELQELLAHVAATVQLRSNIIESEGVNSWKQSSYPMAPIFLCLDELQDGLSSNYDYSTAKRVTELQSLLKEGLKRVGVYVFLASELPNQQKGETQAVMSLRTHMSRKVLLGEVAPGLQKQLLGTSVDRHQQELLGVKGRAVVLTYQENLQIFQGFAPVEGVQQYKKICDGVWTQADE